MWYESFTKSQAIYNKIIQATTWSPVGQTNTIKQAAKCPNMNEVTPFKKSKIELTSRKKNVKRITVNKNDNLWTTISWRGTGT